MCTDYLVDAAYQGLAYYTMSAMTNNSFKLACMAGFYRGIQAAGAAVSFGMDAVRLSVLQLHYFTAVMPSKSLLTCILI